MAEQQIIQNPSVTPGDLKIELSGGYVTAISGHPVGGTGGGGGPSVVYTGVVGEINVNNQQGTIGLADEVKEKLSSIPTKVSDLSDSANYYTSAQVDQKITNIDYTQIVGLVAELNSKQNKLTFGYDDSAISSINGSAIAGQNDMSQYALKNDLDVVSGEVDILTDTSAKWNEVSAKFDTSSWNAYSGKFQLSGDYATKSDLDLYYKKTETSSKDEISDAIKDFITDADVTAKNYLTEASGNLLYPKLPNELDTGVQYAYTKDGWAPIQGAGDVSGITVVNRDNTLTGDGNTNKLGVDLGVVQSKLSDAQIQNITDVTTLKTASSTWDNVSAKLNTSDFNTYTATTAPSTYQPIGDYATNTLVQNTSAAITALIPSTEGLATKTDLQIVSGALDVVSGELPNYLKVTAYEADSGKFALKSEIPTVPTKVSDLTDSANYYKTTDTSSKDELSTEFAKYVTTSTLDTISSTLDDDIEYVSGQVDNKVNKPTSTQTGKLVYDGDTSTWSDIGLDDYVPYSATELVIGSGNEVDYQYNNVKNNFVQGTNNIVTNNNSETFVQGKANKLFTSQDSLVQGFGNSATNYYCLAQGALNDASTYSLTQGSHNTANSYSQAAGQTNSAITASVAFGDANTAKDYSVAQGTQNSADTTAFAQGSANKARYGSFAQGNSNSAYYFALTQGNHNSADYGSFAQGQSNIAQSYSISQGWKNSASNNSVAQGSNNYAKYYSQAFGFGLSIEGIPGDSETYISGGLALGTFNQTSAGVALVIGDGHSNGENADPTRSDSFIIYADGSVSAKGDITANGVKLGGGGDLSNYVPFSATELPVGTNNTATTNAAAIGGLNSAIDLSFALGNGNSAKTTGCAIGEHNIALNKSVAIGYQNTANYNVDIAIGYQNSSYDHAAAIINHNIAKTYSFAAGDCNTAINYSFTFGRGLKLDNTNGGSNSFGGLAIGGWNYTTADAMFVIGNGTPSVNRDYFVLKNDGSVAFGENTSAQFVGSFAEGFHTSAIGVGVRAVGAYTRFSVSNTADHAIYDWEGRGVTVEGYANATTAHIYSGTQGQSDYGKIHDGILKVIGNGAANSNGITGSDALILYRDGSMTAAGGISANSMFAVDSAATLIGASRQTSAHYGVDTTALGTTWVGVGGNGMHQGFIKYTDGGNVGALNTTSTIQINIKPENAGYNGEMTLTNVNGSTTSQSKVVNVPTASYNSMSSFDDTNGPNYMLRKTASGFDIGAAVINVTALPATTEANAYYFVYDL